jgi:CheY-like chemotaxis protein
MGLKAVEISATKEYDIIFMDMQMPIMDGLEATRLIKERGGDGDLTAPKIVFCTAHAMADFRFQAEQAGWSPPSLSI